MSDLNPLADLIPDFPTEMDAIEAQLQQELQRMFEVDTQQYLQTYITLSQSLQPQSWTADIQELYRCIHTIKGGAVTVGAEAILQVATALEDLLSELRYLQVAPPLADGYLSGLLLEAGELLVASIPLPSLGQSALSVVQSTLDRLLEMRQEIQQRYLPESNERTQLFCEFAEQGFDLLVLELEIALEQITALEPGDQIADPTIAIACQTLQQLTQVGQDLEFEPGWTYLLAQAQLLLQQPQPQIWVTEWPVHLRCLKDCARQGGKLDQPSEPSPELLPLEPVQDSDWDIADLDELALSPLDDSSLAPAAEFDSLFSDLEPLPCDETLTPISLEPAMTNLDSLETWEITDLEPDLTVATPTPARSLSTATAKVQIPVPLERLDDSARHLVETLLSARVTQGFYDTLQSQLVQLVRLAQDSAEYITRLRQIQDDYALLSNAAPDRSNPATGPVLERYRQGYAMINRLLEVNLRLSELGAETAVSAQQTSDSLKAMNRNLLTLQQTVEANRLVSFQTLCLRARGILRDLTNRYDKPAQLVVQGEKLELDAGTLQGLEPILLHLLRNAYDHGLESPQERQHLGKPEQGTMTLTLRRQGNSYLIMLRDDGRGIVPEAIQQLAETKRLPLTRTDTMANLLAVLCQPGFSSKTAVTEVSGRGVGMDVVATQVASLGGRLSLSTTVGAGTTFYIQLPVPHLLVRCVLVRAGDHTFAIPSEEISTTTLLTNLTATPTGQPYPGYSWSIREQEQEYPGLELLEYWQPRETGRLPSGQELATSGIALDALPETAVCLKIAPLSLTDTQTQKHAWLIADDLIGQVDLLMNPLPQPLVAPIGLLGLSFQADGKLIPVLEPNRLAEWLVNLELNLSQMTAAAPVAMVAPPMSCGQQATALAAGNCPETPTQTSPSLSQTILVVDDAALVRRRVEASLTAYGYAVQTCSDGLEAWNWLQNHPLPRLVITDIEMPNMDGFTLIDRCRQAGMAMPVIVISSRLSEEWGREARRLGANDYLTKGFTTPELLSKVNAYTQ